MKLPTPRLYQFHNSRFYQEDLYSTYMKRIVVMCEGNVLLDAVRVVDRYKDTKWMLDGEKVWSSRISTLLNGFGKQGIKRCVIHLHVEDNVGRTTDLFVPRVIKYLVTYHDGVCDCKALTETQRLENFGDAMRVMKK